MSRKRVNCSAGSRPNTRSETSSDPAATARTVGSRSGRIVRIQRPPIGSGMLKSTVIKEVHATYSPRPGIEAERPRPETVWPRVFLAGDWTATGWPATMEGAVRSGYLAAQSLARVAGQKDATFLVPNLPATGFMRLFG